AGVPQFHDKRSGTEGPGAGRQLRVPDSPWRGSRPRAHTAQPAAAFVVHAGRARQRTRRQEPARRSRADLAPDRVVSAPTRAIDPALTPSIAPAMLSAPRRGRGHGRAILALGTCIAALLLSPLALLAIDAHTAGWSEIHHVLFRARSLLLRHTVLLTLLVVLLAAVLGVATAWCTERTRLPARRLWTVLLVLPVAIPDDVVGYAWHTYDPNMSGLVAATLVMTLGTYPLVYLPVAAALRRADPAMQETAYSLGAGRLATFWRVTLPLIRTAAVGGCVLVALTAIAEYGTFEIVRYQTFTTEIFTEFQFNSRAAAALSVPLVCLALLVLAVDGIVPTRSSTRSVPPRSPSRARLGWTAVP